MPAPQAHNHHRIVGVVSAHNAGGDSKPQIIGVLRAKPSEKPLRTADPRPSQRAGRRQTPRGMARGHKACFQRRDSFFLG